VLSEATEATKNEEENEEENPKKAAGALYMKLYSLMCSLNETFEAPNTRKLT
jgi:hypothetical protein